MSLGRPRNIALRNIASLSYIQRAYLAHHSYSWGRGPVVAGAFALYGASQFSQLHRALAEFGG